MVNTILARRINHIVAKGDNPAWPKGSKSRGFSTIRLIEYFRAMESRITPEIEVGVLDLRHTELLALLPQSFTTSEAVAIGKKIGLSESTVKRFLREGAREFIRKEAHGRYCKS